MSIYGETVLIRGGGDIASGTISRLHNCGFKLLVLEISQPTAIRRCVSFSEAVYDGTTTVEGITAELIDTPQSREITWEDGKVPILIDPTAASINTVKPFAVVDAILAKKNCGTTMDMAPITIGLGPGFYAGKDVHAAIETARGHQLGKIIYDGSALNATGIPGNIGGFTKERVLYAPLDGKIKVLKGIGDQVEKGETVARIGSMEILAQIPGFVRGMTRDGTKVRKGAKIGDIDPRLSERPNCFTISDKARSISGSVLEALLVLAMRLPGV